MARKNTVNMVIGSNLVSTMAQTLAKDYYTAIVELISNSFDADAENVKIDIDTLEDRMIIEDDGVGMDEKGIENFYRLGDSEKVDNPITAKGRTKIGKFGIATVLL